MCPSSDEAEFLWRLARASRDLSLLPNMEAERKKQLTFEAFEYAKRALDKDDKCFAAHKVRQRFIPLQDACQCSLNYELHSSPDTVVRRVSQ